MRFVPSWVLVALGLAMIGLAGACSPSPPPGYVLVPAPEPPPGPAAFRELPQLGPTGGTFCLAPPESGVRVFVRSGTASNALMSVLDVRDRPRGDPWACV